MTTAVPCDVDRLKDAPPISVEELIPLLSPVSDPESDRQFRDGRGADLLAATWALVKRYAPAAPSEVQKEAIIRAAGWIASNRAASGIVSETVGPLSVTYAAGMTGALRASGAAGLLSPWRVRRGRAAR